MINRKNYKQFQTKKQEILQQNENSYILWTPLLNRTEEKKIQRHMKS